MSMQTGPADTFGYMLMGFGVILGVLGIYVISLWMRMRRLRRDLADLGADGDDTWPGA